MFMVYYVLDPVSYTHLDVYKRQHIGCTADIDSLIHMSLRTSLADGWAGSMIGTRFSDILFGTPTVRETEANLGVLEENKVNIILHGHEPSLSEMIVLASEDLELVELAKEVGADGINLAGMCCTGNEVTMRHGVKTAGDFHQQELAIVMALVGAELGSAFASKGGGVYTWVKEAFNKHLGFTAIFLQWIQNVV